MRLLVLISCFLGFVSNGFAYDIKPYLSSETLKEKGRSVLNLVFCPLEYRDENIFLQDVGALVQKLKQTRPFDEFENFRFYVLSIPEAEQGYNFKRMPGVPPLKPRKDFLEEIALKTGPDYKLVVLDAQGFSSCAELSSRNNFSVLILGKAGWKNSRSFAKGFLHELGHSLGLRDEGINKEASLCLAGKPNCALTKEEAQEWWGDLAGKNELVKYIPGCCGSRKNIRPTIASLMNDPDKASDFGPVNERYLREELKK